jgi:probable phosphoglycerate mutase
MTPSPPAKALPDTPRRRRVYLLRHGEVSYFNAAGKPVDPRTVSLTAAGRIQAEAIAGTLRDAPLDRAVCSALNRTRETAEIALQSRAIAIEEAPGLREIRAGRFREIPADRLEAELAYGFDQAGVAGAHFVGGEEFIAFQTRVLEAWHEILLGAPWIHLLVVGHDAVNRVLLGWAAGAGLGVMAGFEQDMCCLNIIDVDIRDGKIERAFIKAMNVTPYDLSKISLNLTTMETIHRSYRPDGRATKNR